MDDAVVNTIFEKKTCMMVRGAMVLLKGVQIGTLCNMKGLTIGDECNSSIVPNIGAQEEETPTIYREKVMLWNQRLRHIREKGLRLLHSKCMVEGMSKLSLYFYFCEHYVYEKHNRVRFLSGATREE
jgi:hypothetical protein